ncbi:hypothetical protein QYF61_022868 [Mycteria americana]|uniref:Uncharacterized protein n=1 Tax=Mycteria americana TaxID=33587 RepID=A0AAN7S0K2_MYCAM|nr:hypothetical protein QYF61_022868 [Mycteria americana]
MSLSTIYWSCLQPQFLQPIPISLVLQTLPRLRCPSLDTLQPLNVSLGVRGPTLNTAFEVRPHQCQVQGHDHCPSPAGHAIPDTSQDAVGCLGHLGTLLAHIQAAVNQHPQVLFRWAAFQPLFPKPVALHGVAVTQVQDLALGLVGSHTIDLGPSIQPVQVPLQSLPTLQQINTPAQLGVICKLTESALDPFVQIIDKDVKQNWPQHRALGNTACDRPPTGVNSIHHSSLGPAIQPVLYPAKRMPIQAVSSQFLQDNAVGNSVKGFTEVQDCFPRDSVNQSPKLAKVCPPEVQRSSSADPAPYFSENRKLSFHDCYAQDGLQPSHHQVLLCSQTTSLAGFSRDLPAARLWTVVVSPDTSSEFSGFDNFTLQTGSGIIRAHEEERGYRHLLLGVVTSMLSIHVHSHLGPALVALQSEVNPIHSRASTPEPLNTLVGNTDISTASDALRCACSGMDLLTATDASGCPAPMWTRPQVTVPSIRVHTGVPACPAQQHRNSSDALAICQPRRIATAVIKCSQAEQSKISSSTAVQASSESKNQPLTSPGL